MDQIHYSPPEKYNLDEIDGEDCFVSVNWTWNGVSTDETNVMMMTKHNKILHQYLIQIKTK